MTGAFGEHWLWPWTRPGLPSTRAWLDHDYEQREPWRTDDRQLGLYIDRVEVVDDDFVWHLWPGHDVPVVVRAPAVVFAPEPGALSLNDALGCEVASWDNQFDHVLSGCTAIHGVSVLMVGSSADDLIPSIAIAMESTSRVGRLVVAAPCGEPDVPESLRDQRVLFAPRETLCGRLRRHGRKLVLRAAQDDVVIDVVITTERKPWSWRQLDPTVPQTVIAHRGFFVAGVAAGVSESDETAGARSGDVAANAAVDYLVRRLTRR